MARVLCVGIATLDIVNRVADYPEEDAEVRAMAQQQRAGGNACNTAQVLAQLGAEAHWVGNLSDNAQVIQDAFARVGVDVSMATICPDTVTPTSYVTLSQASGSRTIVHYRDMPEYSAQDFSCLDLRSFDWIHFEGRAPQQLAQMMQRARGVCGMPVSLEVEKPREGIEALFEEADWLFFSKDYATQKGYPDAQALLQDLPIGVPATCTWGDQGAWMRTPEGELLHEPAWQPAQVVDTLGAGDVFNAALIHALSQGGAVQQALGAAVVLAGEQCGREGVVLGDE